MIRLKSAILLMFASVALSACVTGARMSRPAGLLTPARLVGVDPTVRLEYRGYDDFRSNFNRGVDRARAAATDGSFDFLALSGGGATGAFGAGVLVGLTKGGQRPRFEVVTGVSTGALIAPYAFLGPDWDAQLEGAYTSGRTAELMKSQGLGSLFSVGVFDGGALRSLVADAITPELVAAVASEYAKGRVLIVATTNLDTGEPVLWDIGAIASHSGDIARNLFIDVLVASASIPGAFPPVLMHVEGPGGEYDEMQVDGSVTMPFVIAPDAAFIALGSFEPMRGANLYVIINGQLEATPQLSSSNTVAMMIRTAELSMMRMARSDINVASQFSQQYGIALRFTYLPPGFPSGGSMDFRKDKMRELFNYAESCAAKSRIWLTGQDMLNKQEPKTTQTDDRTACPVSIEHHGGR